MRVGLSAGLPTLGVMALSFSCCRIKNTWKSVPSKVYVMTQRLFDLCPCSTLVLGMSKLALAKGLPKCWYQKNPRAGRALHSSPSLHQPLDFQWRQTTADFASPGDRLKEAVRLMFFVMPALSRHQRGGLSRLACPCPDSLQKPVHLRQNGISSCC